MQFMQLWRFHDLQDQDCGLLVQSHHLQGIFHSSFHGFTVVFGAKGQNVDNALVLTGWTIVWEAEGGEDVEDGQGGLSMIKAL